MTAAVVCCGFLHINVPNGSGTIMIEILHMKSFFIPFASCRAVTEIAKNYKEAGVFLLRGKWTSLHDDACCC